MTLITALAGIAVGYLGKSSSNESANNGESGNDNSAYVQDLKDQVSDHEKTIESLRNTGEKANVRATKAANELDKLKTRIGDILGPKHDKIKSMRMSLARMEQDTGVSQDHRQRLEELSLIHI